YVEKTGSFTTDSFSESKRNRFPMLEQCPKETECKIVTDNKDYFDKFFKENVVCFFPSSRSEPPHWLNPSSIRDQPVFHTEMRVAGLRDKPIVVERVSEKNKQWLLGVILDPMIDFERVSERFAIRGNMTDKLVFKETRNNVVLLLREILRDQSVGLGI